MTNERGCYFNARALQFDPWRHAQRARETTDVGGGVVVLRLCRGVERVGERREIALESVERMSHDLRAALARGENPVLMTLELVLEAQ